MIRRFAALWPKHATRVVLAVAVAGLFAVSAAHATITETGSVYPTTSPSTWTGGSSGTKARVGYTAPGTLTIKRADSPGPLDTTVVVCYNVAHMEVIAHGYKLSRPRTY